MPLGQIPIYFLQNRVPLWNIDPWLLFCFIGFLYWLTHIALIFWSIIRPLSWSLLWSHLTIINFNVIIPFFVHLDSCRFYHLHSLTSYLWFSCTYVLIHSLLKPFYLLPFHLELLKFYYFSELLIYHFLYIYHNILRLSMTS